MTTEMIFDIDSMPRGGPEAAPWLGLRLETGRLDYLYCNDVDLYCNDVNHLTAGWSALLEWDCDDRGSA